MNTSSRTPQLLYTVLGAGLLLFSLMLFSFKDEEDPLHKRSFIISLSETKNGVVAKKVIMDRIEFKNGKLRTDFLQKKFGYKWLRYHINKDSIFTDSTDTEVRLLEVEATATNGANQTVYVNFVICEWDIDGTIKITKNDKLKKYYDMAGFEKGGKPKKQKKKKEEPAVFELKWD
jgi:hypothetical protein